ncbi:restriction endonuclease subunit S [Corynebacterium phoceense]|uniref:restriction endonuclease subunit S n=1 Tax=Corynebacterium phoceense TaxID=1686286 RepID=UPI0034CEC789
MLNETNVRLNEKMATLPRLSVSQGKGVVPSDSLNVNSMQASNYEKYKIVQPGHLVVNRFNAYKGALGRAPFRGIVSPDYFTGEINRSRSDDRYIEYFLRAKPTANLIERDMSGMGSGDPNSSAFSRFDVRSFLNLTIPVTDLQRQQRIADYLDRETAEIDAAVADLDRYVKLLEKRGKVLIEKTVNGGTYSFSPLWSKIRVQNGFAFDSEKFSPTKELPVAKIGNVLPGDFSEFIDASELPSESFLIKDGDLVVGMSGDFNRTIWNKGKAALNQRVCILKPIADDDIRYINYAIGSGLKKIHSTKFSTTLKNLSTEEILAIRVPHRTVTEQKEIATYLDKETAEINDLVVESTRLRDLLLKRRSVLIAEVVTGRKQV